MLDGSLARIIASLGFVIAALTPCMADASELVMFFRTGCVWCERWDRDVGRVYDKTAEGKSLPLRRIDIMVERTGGIVLKEPVRFTPTFVVVDQGREIGRITGYAGEDAFWGLLNSIASKINQPAATNRI